ncbi:MAG: branched-chain amino acid ABC transporter permease [Gammaproteobacteria bacterium]|nr:branched-chain amino acid ABC transporter permease [Gammaproteobacteria bacterium]
MNQDNRVARISWSIALALAFLLPVLCNYDKFILHTSISIVFNVALATSMWLIWTLGLISFAHAGFMGIGAYTTALLFTEWGWPLWVGMWLGAAVAAMIAFAISIPLMRTRAVYFFMASWAVGEVIKRIFAYYRGLFGGWDGIFNILPPKLSIFSLQIDFASRVAYYYLALIFCTLIVFAIYRINRSRTGMIYWSIHESEILAQHVGINVLKHKVVCFTVACFFAGLTGALYAHYHTYINPKTFDIWQSEFSLVHIIVGGLSTVAGPVLGASILTIVDELLRPTGHYRVIFFGIVVILTVLFLPGGLETIPARIRSQVNKFRNNRKKAQDDAVTYNQ